MACLALLGLLGCASRGGWMEGDEVNAEVRRVLESEPEDSCIAVDTRTTSFMFPSGLDEERGRLLRALACAEAVPAGPRDTQAIVEEFHGAPPAEGCPPPEVTEIQVWYPDCVCRARRLAIGSNVLGYRVDLDDRQFGDDRSLTYRMRLVASPALDDAWIAVLAAVERSPASRAMKAAAD